MSAPGSHPFVALFAAPAASAAVLARLVPSVSSTSAGADELVWLLQVLEAIATADSAEDDDPPRSSEPTPPRSAASSSPRVPEVVR